MIQNNIQIPSYQPWELPISYFSKLEEKVTLLSQQHFQQIGTASADCWTRFKEYMQAITPCSKSIRGLIDLYRSSKKSLTEQECETIWAAVHYMDSHSNGAGKRVQEELKTLFSLFSSEQQDRCLKYIAKAALFQEKQHLLNQVLALLSLDQMKALAESQMKC
jgi:hypothetical protein